MIIGCQVNISLKIILSFYVHINIDGILVKKALVDTSSNVNICSNNLLHKHFPSIYVNVKITTISIKGFENTKWECISYITMPIEVGGNYVDQKVYIFLNQFTI